MLSELRLGDGRSQLRARGPRSRVRKRPGDPRFTLRSAQEPRARGGGGSRDRPGPGAPWRPSGCPPRPDARRLPARARLRACSRSPAPASFSDPRTGPRDLRHVQPQGRVSGQLLAVGGALLRRLPGSPVARLTARLRNRKRLKAATAPEGRAAPAARRGGPQRGPKPATSASPHASPALSLLPGLSSEVKSTGFGDRLAGSTRGPCAFSSSAGRGHLRASGPPSATA